jgi:hypothetical protein
VLQEQRVLQWREPAKPAGVLWRTVLLALGAGAVTFALFLIVGIVRFDMQDLAFYAALPAAFAIAAVAVSSDRRTITIAADGVRVSGLFGVLAGHTIPFARIARAELTIHPAELSPPRLRGAGGGVVIRAAFGDVRTLRLWSRPTEKMSGRRLLAAVLDGGVDAQAVLASFRSHDIEAASVVPASGNSTPSLPRIIVLGTLGAIMLAVFLWNQERGASAPGMTAPVIECITMGPGGTFEVRVKSSNELQLVQFSTTAYQGIKIPLSQIHIERPAPGSGPQSEMRLRFRAALDLKQNYLFSIQDSSGVTAWSPFVSRTGRPQGIRCPASTGAPPLRK